jgi:hypothetical protein
MTSFDCVGADFKPAHGLIGVGAWRTARLYKLGGYD